MKEKWWVLFPLACVLLVFCATRALRRPAASEAARGIEVRQGLALADERVMEAPFQGARANIEATGVEAAGELQRGQLETARKAQWMEQQEAVRELQRRQREATRRLPKNSGLTG